MKRAFLIAAALALSALPARAAETAPPPSPEMQALVRMAQEGQAREAQALTQAYALQAQVADLTRRLDAETKRAEAETKRADEAEAKLGVAKPSDPAPSKGGAAR